MKIFLSGKMDSEHGSWRDQLIGKRYDVELRRELPRWELLRDFKTDLDRPAAEPWGTPPPPAWPEDPNTYVLNLHDYVGPYRTTYPGDDSKHEGYFHGSSWIGSHGEMDPADQRVIMANCLHAICRADLIFAYINTPDCFGTLAEIGFARALSRYVHVFIEDDAHWDAEDYWFVSLMANQSEVNWSNEYHEGKSIDAAFRDALVAWTARPAWQQVRLDQPKSDEWQAEARAMAGAIVNYSKSLAQISQWTSDPRVRAEAGKVLSHMHQLVGR